MAEHGGDRRLEAIGVGGRLGEGAGRELAAAAGTLEAGDAALLEEGLHAADLAHAIALVEAGVLAAEVGARLVRGLRELAAVPPADRVADPLLGDGFANREARLEARDAEAAGWLCAGRARREGTTVAYHIVVRNGLLGLGEAVCEAAERLVDLASTHVDTVTCDYTYLQQAQPTSLAHYLLGFVAPLLRDLDRLEACFARTNRSPAGVGGVNGARWPIDRQRLAALLGFDGVVAHARDAMWQADQPVEVMSVLTTTLVTLARLAEDLQVWATAEFGLVELADRHARGSMVMPQKKNPYALAFVRGVASATIGQLAGTAALGRTSSGQVDNRIFAYGEVPRALDRATKTVRLMAEVIAGMRFDTDLMGRRVAEGWAQATDLAETLVVDAGLDYRTAHRIVGRAVRLAHDRGLGVESMSPALLDEAAEALVGRTLGLDDATVRAALDPDEAVAARRGEGGASREAVQAMLSGSRDRIAASKAWRAAATARVRASAEALAARARELDPQVRDRPAETA